MMILARFLIIDHVEPIILFDPLIRVLILSVIIITPFNMIPEADKARFVIRKERFVKTISAAFIQSSTPTHGAPNA